MKKNCKFASEDILAIEELAEQLSDELNVDDGNEQTSIEPVSDESATEIPFEKDGEGADDAADIIAEADALLAETAELPDEQAVVGDHDVQDVLKSADELEKQIEVAEVLDQADDVEAQICACGDEKPAPSIVESDDQGTCTECNGKGCQKCASEVKPGIEDKIGDEANGGDPSVSALPDTKIDCDTDKEVFGQNTDSAYVAKITARLDRVAAALERRGMKKMAFRVDQLSDKLEASIR